MGTKLGLILAAVLVVGVIGILVLVWVFPSPSRPTRATTDEGVLKFHDVGISPGTILGAEPTGDGNAGDDYRRALKLWKANATDITLIGQSLDELRRGQHEPPAEALAVLKKMAGHLAAGAANAKMEYTFVHTPEHFEIAPILAAADGDRPVYHFQCVALAVELLANYHFGKKEYQQAEKILQDEFVMGWHMMRERAHQEMVLRGVGVQGVALRGLAIVYEQLGGRQDRIAAIHQYLAALEPVGRSYRDKIEIVWDTIPEPGDVFNIIENDEDRAWRVQGLLGLGILKYTVARRGDVRYVKKLLAKYAASSDRFEAAAAKAAQDFPLEKFNQLGTKY